MAAHVADTVAKQGNAKKRKIDDNDGLNAKTPTDGSSSKNNQNSVEYAKECQRKYDIALKELETSKTIVLDSWVKEYRTSIAFFHLTLILRLQVTSVHH